jgi:hypothetical protein
MKQKAKGKPESDEDQIRTQVAKKNMIDAMEKAFGVVTTACKIAGIPRRSYYEWYNGDESFRSAIQALDCENQALDFAETQLFKNINGRDKTCLIFFLKTKGKKRGYIERVEHTGADGNPMQLQIVVNDTATKEAIEKI